MLQSLLTSIDSAGAFQDRDLDKVCYTGIFCLHLQQEILGPRLHVTRYVFDSCYITLKLYRTLSMNDRYVVNCSSLRLSFPRDSTVPPSMYSRASSQVMTFSAQSGILLSLCLLLPLGNVR